MSTPVLESTFDAPPRRSCGVCAHLYAVTSLDPVAECAGGCVVWCCLPLDVTPDGGIADAPRYVTLVAVPWDMRLFDLFDLLAPRRVISARWLTYLWEVSE